MTIKSIDRKILDTQIAILVKKDRLTDAFGEWRYERQIKKSQKTIGEYIPTPYCKTITA